MDGAGLPDIDELAGWMERSRRWHRLTGGVQITVGEDEAGPWWDVPTHGPDAQHCLTRTRRNTICRNRAGAGTDHEGAGPCHLHGYEKGSGYDPRMGAWVMAHGFATALECSPWDGLLWAVRIAAGRVAFIEQKLGTAMSDLDLEPDGVLWHWVKQAEVWHDKLTRVSKLAIDAGVAVQMVRQLELEAQLMLKATGLTLDELGFDEETRQRAMAIMGRQLLALEAEQVGEGR